MFDIFKNLMPGSGRDNLVTHPPRETALVEQYPKLVPMPFGILMPVFNEKDERWVLRVSGWSMIALGVGLALALTAAAVLAIDLVELARRKPV